MFEKSEVVKLIAARVAGSLTTIGEELQNDIVKSVSTPNPPPKFLNSSKIGEPPHKRTGDFAGSIGSGVEIVNDDVVLTVSSDDPKAPALERTRPSMRPALLRARSRILGQIAEDTGLST